MTAVTGIGNGAFESVADECLYGWDDGRKRGPRTMLGTKPARRARSR